MILSFKNEFIEPILFGTKIHTIREDASDRWHEGRIIHFDTNVRTPDQYRFKEDVCTGVQEIIICKYPAYKDIKIDGNHLSDIAFATPNQMQLAVNDGFESLKDLFNFFFPDDGFGMFKGKIIHWTDFRY